MNKKLSLLILGIFFSNAVLTAGWAEQAAENWLSFKGSASRIGVADGMDLKLPLTVSWTHKIEGKTNGFVDWGPVAANGMVYTSDGLNHVLALEAATGKVVWTKEVISNVFSVSFSEDASILFVTTAITTKASPTLFALNPATGEKLWDNMVNGQDAVGGMESAPVVHNGKVYAAYLQYEGKGGVVAYEGATGKMIWHWQQQRFSPYTPLTYAEDSLFVGFENKVLYSFDPASGQIRWVKTDLTDLPYSAPVVVNKRLYLGVGSNLLAMDTSTGAVLWQKALEGQVGHSSPSFFEDTLYIGTDESKVFAIQASGGGILWKAVLDKGQVDSSPIIDSRKKLLYAATQGNALFALDLKDGAVKSQIQLSEDPRGVWKGSPALYQGRLYIGSLDRTFYALE